MLRGGLKIIINLTEKRLYLYQGSGLYGSYPVAIGKPSTPSPVGSWSIANKSILDGKTVLGTRWMGLNTDTYGIHGNNNPKSIGKAVSLGCIRMYNHDVESIFPLIHLGTPVEIVTQSTGSGYPLPPYQPPAPGGGHLVNPSGKTYVIKKGDTLWSIARAKGVNLQDLIKLNPHIDPNLIYPGHVITLP